VSDDDLIQFLWEEAAAAALALHEAASIPDAEAGIAPVDRSLERRARQQRLAG
jgi:hypothetical protein